MDRETPCKAEGTTTFALKPEREISPAADRPESRPVTAWTPPDYVHDPSKKPIVHLPITNSMDKPIRTTHDLMWVYNRYGFASPSTMQSDIPLTQIPGPIDVNMVPWIIEAPLNSVELLEAILKPSHPFEIHTARHVRRGCAQMIGNEWQRALLKRRYAEYIRQQGRLELDREISFICVPTTALETIHTNFFGVFIPVQLQYLSIPWSTEAEPRSLAHPWALVLHDRPWPGTIHTYGNRLGRLLEAHELLGTQLRRSLLKDGTSPLPECLWDWFDGKAGTTAALPYYASEEEVDTSREIADTVVQGEGVHEGPQGVVGPCCLPTFQKGSKNGRF